MSIHVKCKVDIESIRSFSKGKPIDFELMDVVIKLLISNSNFDKDVNYLGQTFFTLLKNARGNKDAMMDLARTYKSSYYYGFDREYTIVTYFVHNVWMTAILNIPEVTDSEIDIDLDTYCCVALKSVNSSDRSTKGFLPMFLSFLECLWSVTRSDRRLRNWRLNRFVKKCPPVPYAPSCDSSGLFMLSIIEQFLASQFKHKVQLSIRYNNYGFVYWPKEYNLRQDLLGKLFNLHKSKQLSIYQFFDGIGSRPFLGNVLNLK